MAWDKENPQSPTFRLGNMATRMSIPKTAVLTAAFVTACGFLYSVSSLYEGVHFSQEPVHHHPIERPTIRDGFQRLYDSIRLPVNADSYTDAYGNTFEIKENGPYWTEPLKDQVLIVDIDTRVPEGSNELWNKGRMNWETLKDEGDGGMISASQMNHFLYGKHLDFVHRLQFQL